MIILGRGRRENFDDYNAKTRIPSDHISMTTEKFFLAGNQLYDI